MRTKLTTIILALICNCYILAQNNLGKSDDASRITLATYVPKQTEGLTPDVQNLLENKLSQITSKNGMGASSKGNERFIMTVNVAVLTKDITPTAPPMHVYNLEVTIYIGDGIDGTLFASKSYELEGVGDSKTEAYKNALYALKTTDPSLKSFIEEGKKKIIEYYNAKCDFIIKEAQTLEAKQDYQQAIYKLTSVPQVCKDCFDKCQPLVGPIYKKYIDFQCKKYMNEANNIWATNQDYSGAQRASEILNKIDPNSSCYKDAIVLSDKIAKRIKEIDQREWNFMLKEQQDSVDIEKATIKAARDIGVAYGENQPEVVYETVVYYWW
jgi:hypothetical protein